MVQLQEVSRLEQENALLIAYLTFNTANSDVPQTDTLLLTEEQKCEVATAEVMRAQRAIEQVRKEHDAQALSAAAEASMLEARMAETVTDMAHFRRRVSSEVDPHNGKIMADRLLRFLADCRKARLAEIDICTLQTASMKVGKSESRVATEPHSTTKRWMVISYSEY